VEERKKKNESRVRATTYPDGSCVVKHYIEDRRSSPLLFP